MTATLATHYDEASETVGLHLAGTIEPLAKGWRLAFTSVVRLTPTPASGVALVERLASYHVVEPDPPSQLAPGDPFTAAALTPGHRPRHANDGPVSGFVIRSDGSTIPLRVAPMTTSAPATPPAARSRSASDGRHTAAPDRSVAPLVPFPRALSVANDNDYADTSRTTLTLRPTSDDRVVTAWNAIVDLERRRVETCALNESGGMPVTAVIDGDFAVGSGDEAYTIDIAAGSVELTAASPAALRHGLITLARWSTVGLPRRASVDDRPTYRWRGLHIDLARRWFEPEVVERLIDEAAWLKLTRLHLHLTDDEAWRLPIDRRPDLAALGGTRGLGLAIPPLLGDGAGPTGRAYTTDEISAWVRRSDDLGVTLVPEVDVPAHAHAALAASPDLRDPDDRSGATSVQFFVDNVLVPGHPATARWLDDVFDAVAELFPSSPWIHIGGDEVPEGAWSGSPVVARFMAAHQLTTTRQVEAAFHRGLVASIAQRTGRRVGAWQEAAESGGFRPDDGYVIGWRTTEASRQLAAEGHDVVVAPGQAYYLDMAVSEDWEAPGASWAGATTLEDVCDFEPDAGWNDVERAHLLGIQACLWTEHVVDATTLDQLMFPRLDAIAERAWTGRIEGGADSLRQRASRRGPSPVGHHRDADEQREQRPSEPGGDSARLDLGTD